MLLRLILALPFMAMIFVGVVKTCLSIAGQIPFDASYPYMAIVPLWPVYIILTARY